MSQHYSDPKRASDPHALPNIEVFHASAGELEIEGSDEPSDPNAKLRAAFVYTLTIEPEDDDPKGHFASGDDVEDRKTVQWIRDELNAGNEWAWFRAKVTATHPDVEGLEGVDYLGACSYTSAEDFKTPGGYYDDMKTQAADELVKKMRAAYDVVAKSER
jgi:hypothetical protein